MKLYIITVASLAVMAAGLAVPHKPDPSPEPKRSLVELPARDASPDAHWRIDEIVQVRNAEPMTPSKTEPPEKRDGDHSAPDAGPEAHWHVDEAVEVRDAEPKPHRTSSPVSFQLFFQ